jgi:two-component system KDP operon response regulator KdpE
VPATPRILVIDDEPQIQRFLRPSLTAEGYDVETAATGAEALALFRAHAPDIVLLDLGLPDVDGKTLIQTMRTTARIPILVLSARDQEAEKIAALDLGADDYIDKPFGIGELMARLRTALRRAARAEGQTLVYRSGKVTVDTLAHRVTLGDEVVKLTPKEYELLHLLVRHAGKVITHRQILANVWGPAHVEDTQYLRVFIQRLRRKIEAEAAAPTIILTEPGVGYRLGEPNSAAP